jgi:hypothetical protein
MIFPPRVVSVEVWIITRSGESCIDLFIRNINIIDSSRTVIYLMHCARTKGAWFRLGAYLSSIRSKTSHQLVQLLGDSINYLSSHVCRRFYFAKTLCLWRFRCGLSPSIRSLLMRVVTQVFNHSPCFIFTF